MDEEVAERTKVLDARDDKCKMQEFQDSDENMSVTSGSTQQSTTSRASRAQVKNAAKHKAKRAKKETDAKIERICESCGHVANYRSMHRYPNPNQQEKWESMPSLG